MRFTCITVHGLVWSQYYLFLRYVIIKRYKPKQTVEAGIGIRSKSVSKMLQGRPTCTDQVSASSNSGLCGPISASKLWGLCSESSSNFRFCAPEIAYIDLDHDVWAIYQEQSTKFVYLRLPPRSARSLLQYIKLIHQIKSWNNMLLYQCNWRHHAILLLCCVS